MKGRLKIMVKCEICGAIEDHDTEIQTCEECSISFCPEHGDSNEGLCEDCGSYDA
jgi:hypothetical protein